MAPLALRSSASLRAASGRQARVACVSSTSARSRSVLCRAAEDNSAAPTPTSSTIFYGGKSYTETEWADAVSSGSLAAVPIPASVSSRSTSAITFNEAMGFSGAVPEKANGRLAMLGFVSAVAAELASGEPVLKQLADEPTGIVAVFALFMAASLVPAFAGKKDEQFGPFTPQAEMTNGRAAMIGFAAMLVIEAVKGSALF